MLSIINKLRIENKIPFAQIKENNIPSMNLAKKLGFIPLEKIHWIEFKTFIKICVHYRFIRL